MKVIKSTQNQYVKNARQLKNKKNRQKSGLFLLEGAHLVEEALYADYPLEYAFVTEETEPGFKEKLACHCETLLISPNLLSIITETEHPQGIVAVARQRIACLSDLTEDSKEGLLMVADGVQDPGNLGTIIRTADAAGAEGVILTANTVDVYNSKTVRSSMGSVLRTKLLIEASSKEIVMWLTANGWKIIVGHVGAARFYYQVDFSGKVAVVVGNENTGPGLEFKEAGLLVKIPCRTESLNVSIASAILLYEKVRRNCI